MEPIDEINNTFPCDRRGGYATKGCSCDGSQTTDTTRVKCLFFGKPVPFKDCRDCTHQKAYLRMIESRK
jgi:hypothetical protein